jgi:hypothetical protein
VQIATPVVLVIAVIAIASGGSTHPAHPVSRKAAAAAARATAVTKAAAARAQAQAATAKTAKKKGATMRAARSYIASFGPDAQQVSAYVSDVQVALGLLIKSPTQANLDQVAQLAQEAHDGLDNLRLNLAPGWDGDSDTLGSAELNVSSGSNDLKNAMGALVAYTGDPNAATLAHFTTQYQNAAGEWNSGVSVIWRLAHRSAPPTV